MSSSTVSTTTTSKKADDPVEQHHPSSDGWIVRPGYSSGASSYSGSDAGDDDDDDALGENGSPRLPRQRKSEVLSHSTILGLSTLRQDIREEGDLAKTVVRIEVRTHKRHFAIIIQDVRWVERFTCFLPFMNLFPSLLDSI